MEILRSLSNWDRLATGARHMADLCTAFLAVMAPASFRCHGEVEVRLFARGLYAAFPAGHCRPVICHQKSASGSTKTCHTKTRSWIVPMNSQLGHQQGFPVPTIAILRLSNFLSVSTIAHRHGVSLCIWTESILAPFGRSIFCSSVIFSSYLKIFIISYPSFRIRSTAPKSTSTAGWRI